MSNTANNIAALIEQAEDDNLDHGFRFVHDQLQVGDQLPHSWCEEEDREHRGTCAFEAYEHCAEYAKHSNGWIVMITGVRTGSGHLAYEVIIDESAVVGIWRVQ